jgi:citrate lyase subunit beta/citryl-CoA lyase
MIAVRSMLSVPGDRPDRFFKAAACGTGAVIVDLEDGVAAARKDVARAAAAEWLSVLEPGPVEVWVRVNSGARLAADVAAVAAAAGGRLSGVVVPKADYEALAETCRVLDDSERRAGLVAGSIGVAPLIETAAGVLGAAVLLGAARVRRVQLGEADLTADLGLTPGSDGTELLWARSTVVAACAAAGVGPPVAPVSIELADLEALAASTEALRRLGFVGRACVHPAQVEVVERVFAPSDSELSAARAVLDRLGEATAAGAGVTVGGDGRMIDEAVACAARRMLALAGEPT